jgi:hypothetical protein
MRKDSSKQRAANRKQQVYRLTGLQAYSVWRAADRCMRISVAGRLASSSCRPRGAQGSQGDSEQFLKIGGAGLALGFGKGGIGGAFIVAEVEQGGFDVCLNARGRRRCRFFGRNSDGFEFVAEFEDHALGGFAADAGDFREAREISGPDGGDKLLHIHTGENLEGERGTDSGSAEEELEEVLFARGKKAVESESVFADMGVNQQSDLRMQIGKSGKGGEGDGDKIADTADVEDYLVGTFIEEAAAEESNHRWPVLPGEGGSVNEGEG